MRTFFRCSVRDLFLVTFLVAVLLALRATIAQAIDAAWSTVVYLVTGDGVVIHRFRDDLQHRD